MTVFSRFFSVACATALCACSTDVSPDYESWKTAWPNSAAGGSIRSVSIPAQTNHAQISSEGVSHTTEIPYSAPASTTVPVVAPTVVTQSHVAVSANATARTGPAKLTVDFGFFPSGTACDVFGTRGDVRLKVGREIEYTISGDTGNVSFTCRQPDGRGFSVNTGPLLPAGSHRRVAVQINQDNNAHVLWNQGGLRRSTHHGVLNWH